jgi:solute carrier family 25 (mitochondrial carnitine/acylcarnitine transporter), member 20/29
MKRVFTAQNLHARKGGPDGKTLNPIQLIIAGASAGIANSVVSGPVEHIRIREYESSVICTV